MVEEVTLRRKYLNSGDVFILDLGLHLIQVRNDSLACTYNLVVTVDYTCTYCTLSALIDSLPPPSHIHAHCSGMAKSRIKTRGQRQLST